MKRTNSEVVLVQHRYYLLCLWLLNSGADCSITNKEGQMASDLAQKKDYYRTVEVLKGCQ